MAVLKKRALAEYSQVVQEEAGTRSLQLIKKPYISVSPLENNISNALEKSETNEELLSCLNFIQHNLQVLAEDKVILMRRLVEIYNTNKASYIRLKIVGILGDLTKVPKFDIQLIGNEMVKLLLNEPSNKVCASMLNTLAKLGSLLATDSPLLNKIISVAKQLINSTNHMVKCCCLSLLGELSNQNNFQAENVKLLCKFTRSQDPRVRTTAYDSLLLLHDRGQKLEFCIYSDICLALQDDNENVRQSALRIVWVLSHTYAESLVVIPECQDGIRLVDDAFAKICQAISDLSVNVRTLAAELLGSMSNVNSHFLEQTLDKKLMSDMRRKRSAHERQWETVTSGEWASGARWADDKPRENLDADSVSLIHSGACGAFVHGLEDEFMEVRSASLDSLCQLALSNPRFATLSLDFLVDMFNDEIEEVRLKAIDCMTKISELIILREDQFEIILGVLEDSNVEIREGLHRMLGACRLSTKACLKLCVQSLLDNLKRYSQDKRSIWRCLQLLGSRHPDLTLLLVPELLTVHPFFDMPEADVEDPSYVCVLLLVFNAAKLCPQILSLFEEHIRRHYRYLRDTISNFVPHLQLTNLDEEVLHTELQTNTSYFLQNVMSRLNQPTSSSNQIKVWDAACHDLIRLAQIDRNLSHGVKLLATQLECHILIAKIMNCPAWVDVSSLNAQDGEVVKNLIDQLQRRSLRLQYMYSNLSSDEELLIQSTRLQAMAIQLVYIVRASNTSALALSDHFVSRVETLKRSGSLPSFTECIVKEISHLEDTKPGVLSRVLLPILQQHIYTAPFCLPKQAFKLSAEILEPSGESDNPQKFLAGFVLGVGLDAEIYGLTHPEYLRISVKYPDLNTQLIIPQESHMKALMHYPCPDSEESLCIMISGHRLRTSVLVSHQVWTESSHVEIALVLDVTDPEVPPALKRWRGFSENSFIIELCKPVRVLVSPKAIKRGI